MSIVVACLVCTNRPEWEPFWRHQIAKQRGVETVTFVDARPAKEANIAMKRTELLWKVFNTEMSCGDCHGDGSNNPHGIGTECQACDGIGTVTSAFDYFAFFDDDDWSDMDRLAIGVAYMQRDPNIFAVGSRDSHFVNVRTRESRYYEAPEGIIFNGAVFRNRKIPPSFNAALTVGEDTAWLQAWQANKPTYIITPGQHLWLSHERNTTNRITEHAFEDGQLAGKRISEEEWSLIPHP